MKDGRSLIGRQRAQHMERASKLLFAVLGHALEGLGGRADFLFALRREAFECLIARHDPGTDSGGLRVKITETVEDPSALHGGEAVEAGLAAQSALLLLDTHVLVVLEPLRQVLAGRILSRIRVEPTLGSKLPFARETLPPGTAHPVWAGAHHRPRPGGPVVLSPGTRLRRLRKREQGREQGDPRRPTRTAAAADNAGLLSVHVPLHRGRSDVDGTSFGASFHFVVSPREPG